MGDRRSKLRALQKGSATASLAPSRVLFLSGIGTWDIPDMYWVGSRPGMMLSTGLAAPPRPLVLGWPCQATL